MSMSSYLISHNHSLYILLTGTRNMTDIRKIIGAKYLKPNYQENVDRLMPFWKEHTHTHNNQKKYEPIVKRLKPFLKEQEGSIKYQTDIKQETTTPVMGGKISSQNPYIKTPSFDEKTQTFKAYYDKIGKKWTIGYGHTDGVEPEDTATINQADAFLEEDGKRLIHETDNLLKQKYEISIFELPEPGQDLVGDMGFNIGPDKFTTEWPNMLNALKNKDWVTVSKEYTATNTPERNKARFEKWIEPRLIAEQSFQRWEDTQAYNKLQPNKEMKPLIENQQRADINLQQSKSDKFEQSEQIEKPNDAVNEDIFLQNTDVPFVDRILNPENYIKPKEQIDSEGRSFIETHRMSAHKGFVFPTVVIEDNKYIDLIDRYKGNIDDVLDYNKKTGNIIMFPSDEEAQNFSINYKDIPSAQKFNEYYTPDHSKFEQQDKKESLKKQKIVYDTMPDLVNAIQTQQIPKEKIKGFVTDAASSKLLSEIGERIHVPEFIENLGIDVEVKGKDKFAIKGKGITYKHEPGEQSVSGKGFTYTQTDEQKRLEKKFGKEGGITGSVGISKSDFGDEKTIGGQINIPTDKIFRRRKRK